MLSRYNTFFVLYPVGILSEAIEIYGSLQEAQGVNSLLGYLEKAVLYLTYVPGMLTPDTQEGLMRFKGHSTNAMSRVQQVLM